MIINKETTNARGSLPYLHRVECYAALTKISKHFLRKCHSADGVFKSYCFSTFILKEASIDNINRPFLNRVIPSLVNGDLLNLRFIFAC